MLIENKIVYSIYYMVYKFDICKSPIDVLI